MIEIKEVINKNDIKKFVDFPHKLYKNNPHFVPFLNVDEINKFDAKKNESFEDCDTKCFLAYKDGELVGRIAGIIQKAYNEKAGQKRVRFSRFDCINDTEVSRALFSKVESWAKDKGMEIIHGPMGYNDLDREGLLIEGFDQMSTFEEQYNFPYYANLIEDYGFKKEVDWVEFRLFAPKGVNERIERIANIASKRYKLKLVVPTTIKSFIKLYKDDFFDTLDAAYSNLYGVVPFKSEKMKNAVISQFSLILSKDYVVGVVNEEGKLIAFGLAFPSLSESVNKSRGKLLPFGIFRILKQIKSPNSIDLGLIAIRPEYQNKGVNAMILSYLIKGMISHGIEYAETNLMLEYNTKIQSQWSMFDYIQHKRRRSYYKEIK